MYQVTLWLAAQTLCEHKTVTLLVSFLGFLQPAANISGKQGLVSNFAGIHQGADGMLTANCHLPTLLT